jgi:putative peptide zinc metalloprotease protein
VLAGLYAATSAEILLLVIGLTHLELLQQLLPFARFDGYFILSDLVGVPDMFAHVIPVLRGALRRRGGRVAGLDRRAQTVIAVWALVVVPLLTLAMAYLLLHLPEANRALWHSAGHAARLTTAQLASHRYVAAAVDAVSTALAVTPIAGSHFIAAGLARRAVDLGRSWSAGRPRRRLLVAVAGVNCAVLLVALWAAQGQFSGW